MAEKLQGTILKVQSICRKNFLELTNEQTDSLQRYVKLLLEWNEKINLISRNDTKNIWYNHILHSLALLFLVELPPSVRVIDLGTGGGLPGIPVSIIRPDLEVTLLDSIRKKTTAVQSMVESLGLLNVKVLTGRAEEVPNTQDYRNKYDIVLSRAVAPLEDLIKWSRLLVNTKSNKGNPIEVETRRKTCELPFLLALKGGDLQGEIVAARVKQGMRGETIINMAFDGSEELSLQEKKIVVVPLNKVQGKA